MPICYAHPLGGCSSKITKEHYISAGVLRRINDAEEISFKGFAFQQTNKYDRFPIKRLSAKMLCESHHKALNDLKLDETACKLIDKMKPAFLSALGRMTSPFSEISHHNGQRIERWLLKILCGMLASGVTPRPAPDITISRQSIPLHILKILFGLDKFPQGLGLYIQRPDRQQINITSGITVTLSGDEANLHSCSVSLFSQPFILVIDPSALEDKEWAYRPDKFGLKKSETNTHVEFVLNW